MAMDAPRATTSKGSIAVGAIPGAIGNGVPGYWSLAPVDSLDLSLASGAPEGPGGLGEFVANDGGWPPGKGRFMVLHQESLTIPFQFHQGSDLCYEGFLAAWI